MWKTIALYDLKKFIRQPARVIGLTGTPILLWLILGSGFGDSFLFSTTAGTINYLQYFYPGTILLQLMFAAIFSTISLIDDRHNGNLKYLFITPLSLNNIAIGKIIGGSLLAFLQALASMLILPLIGFSFDLNIFAISFLNLFILSIFFTSIGFALSTIFETTQGYHAIMNLILVPLWLLSGSVFPFNSAPEILKLIIFLNPLHYAFNLIEAVWINYSSINLSDLYLSYLVIIVVTIIFYLISIYNLNRKKM
ncbi:MAG: ABC transporter permease [Bacteroidetes bacterium]|nr:ABC transporter permease [Bacteroidota bacterium]